MLAGEDTRAGSPVSAPEKLCLGPSWLLRGTGLGGSGSRAERQGNWTWCVCVTGGRPGVALGAGLSPQSGGSPHLGTCVVQGGREHLSDVSQMGFLCAPPDSGGCVVRLWGYTLNMSRVVLKTQIWSCLLSTLALLALDAVELIVLLQDNPCFFLSCVWWHCQCRHLPKKVGGRVILALIVDKLCLSHRICVELFCSG